MHIKPYFWYYFWYGWLSMQIK